MPARLYNNPAYSIYDLSIKQQVTPDGTPTGTPASMIDGNFTTTYQVDKTGRPCSGGFTIDYGSIYKNCVVSISGSLSVSSNQSGGLGWALQSSLDGTNWTTIDSSSTSGTIITEAFFTGYNVCGLRYLKLIGSGSTGGDVYVQTAINQLRLMGC